MSASRLGYYIAILHGALGMNRSVVVFIVCTCHISYRILLGTRHQCLERPLLAVLLVLSLLCTRIMQPFDEMLRRMLKHITLSREALQLKINLFDS